MRKMWLLGLGFAVLGCQAEEGSWEDWKWDWWKKDPPPAAPVSPAVAAPHIAGTVREFAVYDTAGSVPVQGYGVVTGLGKNGSSEVPEHLRDYLVEYLLKRGIGSPQRGTGHVSPMRVLQDLDTAIVLVGGATPFGAPVGSRFDIAVTALPNTQTRSLQGGNLLDSELSLDLGVADPRGRTRVLAEGGGPVFLNPFADPNDEADLIKWREGRVLGGGKVAYAHPVHLQLRQPDFYRANLIAKRLNETFGGSTKVANARDRSTIELTIPREWKGRYERFLELVMHVPLTPAREWEARARELVRMMEAPEAANEDISLILEAMGRNSVPLLKTLYSSRNSSAAFFAARAAGRLGDDSAEQVLLRFATQDNSPLQIPAIEELGRNDAMTSTNTVLATLVDNDNNLVRIAAYEALAHRGDRSVVTRIRIDGQDLTIDLVKSSKAYVIYATQSQEARIALFGPEIPIATPVFFSPPDELAILASRAGDANVNVFRKMPDGKYSPVMAVQPNVKSLVMELASIPAPGADGITYRGLRLNYGELLSVLNRLCQRGDIPAKFNLQSDLPQSRIPGRGPAVGRPDVPGP